MTKRDIFGDLMEGIEAMREHRRGKKTLRTHKVDVKDPPLVDASFIRQTREKLRMSAPLFAQSLRLRARTLERWEQGQDPGPAAAVLISLVHRYPDTLQRIASLTPQRPPRPAAKRAQPSRQPKSRARARR